LAGITKRSKGLFFEALTRAHRQARSTLHF